MRLTELNPRWVGYGGEGYFDKDGNQVTRREAVGIEFDCPCGSCGSPIFIPFANPPDGGPSIPYSITWQRKGSTFEDLTLAPSILRRNRCGWHGYVKNGEIEKA